MKHIIDHPESYLILSIGCTPLATHTVRDIHSLTKLSWLTYIELPYTNQYVIANTFSEVAIDHPYGITFYMKPIFYYPYRVPSGNILFGVCYEPAHLEENSLLLPFRRTSATCDRLRCVSVWHNSNPYSFRDVALDEYDRFGAVGVNWWSGVFAAIPETK